LLRWGENHECGRACLRQIEAAPEDCLVRRILTVWYQGKFLRLLRQAVRRINWMQHKPCLVSPGLRIFEWGKFSGGDPAGPGDTQPRLLDL